MKIKNYPQEERPREKAYHYGIESLNNVELLALILRTGNRQESVLELAQRVIILCLNSRLEVMKEKTVFIGSNNISIISGRELFKEALICGSSRIMVIHNHPSGNPAPSPQDVETTERLYKMADELEIEVVDHLIIGRNKFYSFASKEIIEV